MKRLYSIMQSGFILLTAALIIFSCKKVEQPQPFIPERMFTPTNVKVTGGETKATVSWNKSLFSDGVGVTYTVEISTSADFSGTPAYTTTSDTTEVEITDADVQIKTPYYARVKANESGSIAASKGWAVSTTTFTITGEQLFLPVDDAKLTALTAELSWKITPGVTKIVLQAAGGSVTDIALSADEVAAGVKVLEGLTPSTQYTAELFLGSVSKGEITFSTKSGPPAGTTTVNVTPTDDLASMISAATPGTVFLLQQGTVYKADDVINLPANASITIWGDHGPDKAVLAFNGFSLPATAGTIRFENVDLTGYQNNDPTASKRNYIFNQSAATITESIEFENCTIRNFTNTPMRAQGSNAITINHIKLNNCIVYDCGVNATGGTYAFIHNNVATSKFNNISITNSTLYRIGYSVILHNAAPSVSVLIDNCTIDNSIGDGRYLIDYNAQTIGSFQIKNSILGKSLSPAATARGYRAGTAPTVDNTYQTADAAISANPIPGLINYTGNSTALFTDPSTGNYLIKDANFAGKSSAGDPRWRL